MKTTYLLFFCLLTVFSYSQSSIVKESPCAPLFPGGDAHLVDLIKKNLTYPPSAKRDSVKGKVIVHFEIDSTGKVFNVAITKGIRTDLNEEAMRVVKLLPAFIPCKTKYIEGKPQYTVFDLPIIFQL